MLDSTALAKLLKAESYLKRTTAGFTPAGPWWKAGMPLLWEVRQGISSTVLGAALAKAHGILKETEHGYDPHAPRWREAMELIDGVEEELRRPPVPDLGPILRGDKSVLLWVPTHDTDGLDFTGSQYPAFDSGFSQPGRTVIAPERMRVRRQSGAAGADAFYATGISTIEWWIGHIVKAPATGRWLNRGDVISTIARIAASQGGPHLHTALDCRKLIGRDLLYGGQKKPSDRPRDYTFGSPTIGVQLAKALAA